MTEESKTVENTIRLQDLTVIAGEKTLLDRVNVELLARPFR
ncbi:MAG: hypothetical protein R3C03_11405 [Pirellulaceae bacterium]